mmetsp:Transcript_81281/g.226298  ORF Transcript_81281/g.226298 Transcript_81281/m.226298 type:complete len:200 (-) Transcript_81281:389-988(-)
MPRAAAALSFPAPEQCCPSVLTRGSARRHGRGAFPASRFDAAPDPQKSGWFDGHAAAGHLPCRTLAAGAHERRGHHSGNGAAASPPRAGRIGPHQSAPRYRARGTRAQTVAFAALFGPPEAPRGLDSSGGRVLHLVCVHFGLLQAEVPEDVGVPPEAPRGEAGNRPARPQGRPAGVERIWRLGAIAGLITAFSMEVGNR